MIASLLENLESLQKISFKKDYTLGRYAEKLNKFFDEAYSSMEKIKTTS